MIQKPKSCVPSCQFFTCTQRSVYFKGSTAWCKFADDECEVRTCKYAQCSSHRLLAQGLCATETRQSTDLDVPPDEALKPIRAPSKLAQKLKERELF
jgi:hypothetical protein